MKTEKHALFNRPEKVGALKTKENSFDTKQKANFPQHRAHENDQRKRRALTGHSLTSSSMPWSKEVDKAGMEKNHCGQKLNWVLAMKEGMTPSLTEKKPSSFHAIKTKARASNSLRLLHEAKEKNKKDNHGKSNPAIKN